MKLLLLSLHQLLELLKVVLLLSHVFLDKVHLLGKLLRLQALHLCEVVDSLVQVLNILLLVFKDVQDLIRVSRVRFLVFHPVKVLICFAFVPIHK